MGVIDAEYREDPVRITVQDLLEQKRRELDEWVEAMGPDEDAAVPGFVKLRIIVQALELLAGQQESQEGKKSEIRENSPGVAVEEIMEAVAKARGVGKKHWTTSENAWSSYSWKAALPWNKADRAWRFRAKCPGRKSRCCCRP